MSVVAQQQTSTHPCRHCWSAPNKHTPMFPLLTSTQPARAHVSIADEHATNTRTHVSMLPQPRCSQHPHNAHSTSMADQHPPNAHSISSGDQHPHNTHSISMAEQHDPTHRCLHRWPTPTQQAPMSPLLTSTQPAHTHVSIAGQHPPSKHPCLHLWPASNHQGHCCASPGRGLSTSSTPKLVILQICRGRRGFLIVICITKYSLV